MLPSWQGPRPRFELLLTVVVFLATFVPLSVSFLRTEHQALTASLESKAVSLVRNLSYVASDMMSVGEIARLQQLADYTKTSDPDIRSVRIYAVGGYKAVTTEKDESRRIAPEDESLMSISTLTLRELPDNSFSAAMPVVFGSTPLGVITVEVSRDVVREAMAKAMWTLGFLASFSLIFGALTVKLRRMTGELTAANERLKGLDQAKSEFIGVVSHELRTPMTSINGFLNTILQRGDKITQQKRDEYMQIMLAESTRMVRLINDILDITKIELGRFNIELARVDFSSLVKRVVEGLRIQNKRLVFEVEGADAPREIDVDQDKIQQVLINLLSNAAKYSPDGGKVRVVVEGQPGGVRVSVVDEGPGIPKEHIDKLFRKFYRVETAPGGGRKGPAGTGLGLAIARNVVELHGGRIWAESPGKGTMFRFTIPAQAPVRAS